jgi:tetratricopeptide (TPR) repeat protein
MDETRASGVVRGKIPAWSHLLLAAILVALVGGAFWLKSRPKPDVTQRTHQFDSPESLLGIGIGLHNAKQLDAAMDVYYKLLQFDPANAAAHYNIAQIYSDKGRYPQAQWEYEAALKADPKFLDARLNLGVVLYRQRKFPAAADAFRQVLQASPKHPMGLYDLGLTLVEMGQGHAGEAVRVLTAALREDPKRTDIHYYLGLGLERQRRFPEAKAELQKWLQINPRHADGYLALSRVYMAQGQRQSGLEAIAKAVALNPALAAEAAGRQKKP